jgi:hypothetical protein
MALFVALFVRIVPRRKRMPSENPNPLPDNCLRRLRLFGRRKLPETPNLLSDSRLSRPRQFGRRHKKWHYLALLRAFFRRTMIGVRLGSFGESPRAAFRPLSTGDGERTTHEGRFVAQRGTRSAKARALCAPSRTGCLWFPPHPMWRRGFRERPRFLGKWHPVAPSGTFYGGLLPDLPDKSRLRKMA